MPELFERLCEARERVGRRVRRPAARRRAPPIGGGCKGPCGGSPPSLDEAEFLPSACPAGLREAVQAFAGQPRVQALREERAATRLAQLFQRAGQTMAAGHCERRGCPRALSTGSNRCCAATPIWRMLAERPAVLTRLLRLLGLARWPMRYLMQHPGVHRRIGR
jgi:glutamate-ammonia-ligase adenylyltransferase